ncbi:hypothetical protein ScPMuIL_017596 [Solemya velum]
MQPVVRVRCTTLSCCRVGRPGHNLSDSDIQSDEARQKLFQTLITESTSQQQLNSLCRLLRLWPVLDSMETDLLQENPWVQVFVSMATSDDKDCASIITSVMREIKDTIPLTDQCVKHVYSVLLDHGHTVEAVKCVLMSCRQSLVPVSSRTAASLTTGSDFFQFTKYFLLWDYVELMALDQTIDSYCTMIFY